MLAAHGEPAGQRGGAQGPLDLAHEDAPGGALQRLGQAEHAGGVGQGAAAFGFERGPHDHVAHHRVVDTLDRYRDHGMTAAGEEQLAVVRTEGPVGDNRHPGELAPQLGEIREPTRAGIEHHRIHQAALEQPSQGGQAPAGDHAGPGLGQGAPEGQQRGATLEQGGNRGHRQLPARGSAAGRGRPAPTATSVRTMSPARLSTPRALS